MRIKYSVYLFFLLIVPAIMYAQSGIRDKVALIQVELNKNIDKTLTEYSDLFRKQGNIRKSDDFDNISRKWFGSGFLIRGTDHNLYLITNRHVIDFSGKIKVTFGYQTDNPLSTSKVQVVSALNDTDIAILKIMDDTVDFNDFELPTADDVLVDGQEVWAAGYPGINGQPIWQLSSGVVTNNRLFTDELIVPNRNYVIQHSAPIDSGSSGGPLLIESGIEDYKVAGINTCSVTGRNSTYFAVPSEQISIVFESIIPDHEVDRIESMLVKDAESFLQYLSEDLDFKNAVIIAEELVANYGYTIYQDVKNSLLPSNAKQLENAFRFHSATATMREAAYYQLYGLLIELGDLWEVNNISYTGSGREKQAVLELASGGNAFEVIWILENGNWRISSFTGIDEIDDPIEKYDKEPKRDYEISGSIISTDIGYLLQGGMGVAGEVYGLRYEYRAEIDSFLFFSLGGMVNVSHLSNISYKDQFTSISYDCNAKGIGLNTSVGLGMLFPGSSDGKIQSVPGVQAFLGTTMYSASMEFDGGGVPDDNHNNALFFSYGIRGLLEFRKVTGYFPGIGISFDLMQNYPINLGISINEGYTFPSYTSIGINCLIKF